MVSQWQSDPSMSWAWLDRLDSAPSTFAAGFIVCNENFTKFAMCCFRTCELAEVMKDNVLFGFLRLASFDASMFAIDSLKQQQLNMKYKHARSPSISNKGIAHAVAERFLWHMLQITVEIPLALTWRQAWRQSEDSCHDRKKGSWRDY